MDQIHVRLSVVMDLLCCAEEMVDCPCLVLVQDRSSCCPWVFKTSSLGRPLSLVSWVVVEGHTGKTNKQGPSGNRRAVILSLAFLPQESSRDPFRPLSASHDISFLSCVPAPLLLPFSQRPPPPSIFPGPFLPSPASPCSLASLSCSALHCLISGARCRCQPSLAVCFASHQYSPVVITPSTPMLDSSVIQILIVLGFPYAIGALRSFFAKAPPPSPLQRINNQQGEKVSSRTRAWNRSMLLLLGLTALYHVFYVVFYDPPNIFKTLSLPADCPNFILHQSWKERAALDPAFMNKYPDSMRERFKAMENRLWYEVYGQDAFLNCEYCTERSDFMRYLIPGAMASYVGMAVILGIATTQTSHLNKYRTWGSAALVIISVLEYGTYQRSADIGSLPGLMKHEGWIVGFRGAHLLRHGSLAMMSVVLMGVLLRSTRGGGLRDEVEILNDLCQAQEGMIQRHRALQLARAASLRDPVLRKQFVDYWKKREVEHGLLLSDMEYKEARDLALSRIDVETITQEADEYIDAIIKAGERVSEPMEADASANPAEQTKTAAST